MHNYFVFLRQALKAGCDVSLAKMVLALRLVCQYMPVLDWSFKDNFDVLKDNQN